MIYIHKGVSVSKINYNCHKKATADLYTISDETAVLNNICILAHIYPHGRISCIWIHTLSEACQYKRSDACIYIIVVPKVQDQAEVIFGLIRHKRRACW